MSGTERLRRPLMQMPGGDPVDSGQMSQAPSGQATPSNGNGGGASGPPGVGDAPSPSGAMSFDGSRQTLLQEHKRNRAAFEQSGEALKKLDHVRKGLEKLEDKQDIVTMEDVVGEAGKLAAKGIDPVALAGILADAPQQGGGEALASWVANHAQTAEQAEQQIQQQHDMIKHQMGVSAIHLLMAQANAQHMLGGITPPIGGRPNGENSLTAPGGPDSPEDGEASPGNSLSMRMQ